MLVFASITPHPPIIVQGIGKDNDLENVKETIKAMEELSREFEKAQPDTTIVISQHAPLDYNAYGLNSAQSLAGDFKDFGSDLNYKFENDLVLVDTIIEEMDKNSVPLSPHREVLDHGTLVPLHFLTQNYKTKVVSLSFSFEDLPSHYVYGQIIGEVIRRSTKKIAVIASGDLSHRLIPGAPAGFNPKGKEFDKKLIELLEAKDVEGILNLDEAFVEAAGECGLRSVVILLGILNGQFDFKKLSYEGPFGVGYLVAKFMSSRAATRDPIL